MHYLSNAKMIIGNMFFTNWHIRFFKRLFLLLIPYSLMRIGFYFYHLETYRQFHQEEIFESLLLGIRFDVAALCLINIPIILLSLIPSTKPKFLKFERFLFTVINMAGIIATIDDYELFLFTGKRLSLDFFVISDDIWQQLPQVLQYYWYLPMIGVLMSVGLYYADKKLISLKFKKVKWSVHLIGGVLVLGISFIGIRGGFQHKSINVQSAFIQGKNELGHLVLNTPYHFLRTLNNRRILPLTYFSNDSLAKNLILNHRDLRDSKKNLKKFNVVLIILESFSKEYLDQGYAPFLTELGQQGLYFERHMANGRKSIECLPSLICGLPSLIDDPISKSVFQGNNFNCMTDILKVAGYTNHFYHAGSRGTMGFESYTLANGFDRYFSREDYPDKNDYDGSWGIYDGPFLKYVKNNLSNTPTPFMAGIFTLSSHQPYSIPEQYKGKFKKGPLEIHESIGYTDFALKEFFSSIKNEAWYKNTLFVITSDHTQKLSTKKYLNFAGKYRVPLILFAPGHDWGEVKTNKVTQHADIPDTVLDFLGLRNEDLPVMGRSVLSQDTGMAINYAGGRMYFMAQDDRIVTLDRNNKIEGYHYDWESGNLQSEGKSEAKILKAYMQYFINGMINNNLSLYR